ncbi:MAG: hypothetical protein GY859_19645 [Desulfobacterales bacterium]|nr:hypothetical protein [Desulfobacterales bacterium]
MKKITCFICREKVIWGEDTVYSENGALICMSCFETEAGRKGIEIREGKIVSNHAAPSPLQGKCLSCLSCCRDIGCSLIHPTKGCLIYDKRPDACREFFCKELIEDEAEE